MFFFVSFSFSVWVWALFAWRNFFWCFMGKWVKHGWQQGYGHTTTISRPQAGTERMLFDKHERALGHWEFLFFLL
jgi:hypothetical protein